MGEGLRWRQTLSVTVTDRSPSRDLCSRRQQENTWAVALSGVELLPGSHREETLVGWRPNSAGKTGLELRNLDPVLQSVLWRSHVRLTLDRDLWRTLKVSNGPRALSPAAKHPRNARRVQLGGPPCVVAPLSICAHVQVWRQCDSNSAWLETQLPSVPGL